jgi:hypothetical protein
LTIERIDNLYTATAVEDVVQLLDEVDVARASF